MENNEPENVQPEVIIKYSSYTEAQKRATQKYRQNNKDKVNEQRKKYYRERKEKDPSFLKYKREKAKEYYQRKKQLPTLTNNEDSDTLEAINEEFKKAEPIETFISETIPLTQEEINEVIKSLKIEDNDIIETVEVKPKRKYNKKKPATEQEPKPEAQQIPEEVEAILTKTVKKRKQKKIIEV